MKKYAMKCKCRMKKEELELTPKYKMICPIHKLGIDHIEVTCIDCSIVFETSVRFGRLERCEDCRKARELVRRKKAYQNSLLRNKKSRRKKESVRGAYCMGYNLCKSKKELLCVSCESFTAIFRGVDPGKSIFC